MPITLAEAKVGMADKVDQMIVDEFRRSSLLLDRLVFDNAISPGTGGSTLTYGYIQLKTPSTAAVRAINSEYSAGEAKRVEKTAKAVIMGGSFQVDRVLQFQSSRSLRTATAKTHKRSAASLYKAENILSAPKSFLREGRKNQRLPSPSPCVFRCEPARERPGAWPSH